MALGILCVIAPVLGLPAPRQVSASGVATQLTIAVIGDYGCLASTCASVGVQQEAAVAALVHGWNPNAILTVGDNSYENGTAAEVPVDQQPYAADVSAGHFFQVTGNHDWGSQCSDSTWIQSSTSYFGHPPHYVAHLGGGLIDFFATDLNCADADGYSAGSTQATQYVSALQSSSAVWKITGGHQPFYSSGAAGTQQYTHWAINPLVDLYLSGHDHDFEHLVEGGQHFVVDGVGGTSLFPITGSPISGSVWSDDQDFGAVRLTITQTALTVDYVSLSGVVVHSFTLTKDLSHGFIAGSVADSTSGQALSGATVSDGASSATTSPDGSYVLSGVPVGSYTVTAAAARHASASQAGNASVGSSCDISSASTSAGDRKSAPDGSYPPG